MSRRLEVEAIAVVVASRTEQKEGRRRDKRKSKK